MSLKKPAAIAAGVVLFLSVSVSSQPGNIYSFSGDWDLGVNYTVFESSGQHYIGARGDTVYVVTSNGWVWCQKSTDGGQTFGSPVSVAPGDNPSMRVDTAGVVYVVYERQGDIYFTKSTDGGATFTPSVLVVDVPGLASLQEMPSIAVNNRGQVLIAWFDERTNPRTIFAAASSDSGETFGRNVRVCNVCNSPTDGFDVAADDYGHLYLVMDWWSSPKGPLYLLRSADSGQTFQIRGMVTDFPTDSTTAVAINPSLAAGNGLVGIVWEDYRYGQQTIRFSVSADSGGAFSPSVSVDNSGRPYFPSLVHRNGFFYVAWRNPFVSFSFSPNSGQSFVPSVNVTSYWSTHLYPSLAVNDSGKAFVAWLDDRNDPIFSENYHAFVAQGIPQYVRGDLNLDGGLSPADAVFELNAVFLGQPFPAPFGMADSNCDTELTPADVVLHLNATFLGEGFPCI